MIFLPPAPSLGFVDGGVGWWGSDLILILAVLLLILFLLLAQRVTILVPLLLLLLSRAQEQGRQHDTEQERGTDHRKVLDIYQVSSLMRSRTEQETVVTTRTAAEYATPAEACRRGTQSEVKCTSEDIFGDGKRGQ